MDAWPNFGLKKALNKRFVREVCFENDLGMQVFQGGPRSPVTEWSEKKNLLHGIVNQ